MAWPADYHMHTPLCRHATGEPGEFAAQALKVGLGEIGFSDHSPMRQDDFDKWRMRSDQLDEYVEKVCKARCDYPSLTIKLALEVDYLPGLRKECREIYPSRAFVELMFQKAIPITFGSDAHAPGEVGLNFVEAVQLARSAGYTQSRIFSQRKHTQVTL